MYCHGQSIKRKARIAGSIKEEVKKIEDKSIWDMPEDEFAQMAKNADYRLSTGQASLNEIRKEMGLDEINDPAFDKCYAIVK